MNNTVVQGLKQKIDFVEGENASILYQLHQVQEELEHYCSLMREYERKVSYLNRQLEAITKTSQGKSALLIRLTDMLGITRSDQIEEIRASGFFDEKWYLKHYPDVEKLGMNPIEHYLRYGAKEGRNPGSEFDAVWYLNSYPDVAIKGGNPLLHFVRHGEKEGRRPCQNDYIFPPDPFSLEREWLQQVSNEQAQLAAERQGHVEMLIQAQALLEQEKSELAARHEVLTKAVVEQKHALDEQAQLAAERQGHVEILIQAQALLEQEKSELAARHEVLTEAVVEQKYARDEQAQLAAERQGHVEILIQAQALLEQEKSGLAARVVDAEERAKNNSAEISRLLELADEERSVVEEQIGLIKEIILRESVVLS